MMMEIKARLFKDQSGQNLLPRRDLDSIVKLL